MNRSVLVFCLSFLIVATGILCLIAPHSHATNISQPSPDQHASHPQQHSSQNESGHEGNCCLDIQPATILQQSDAGFRVQSLTISPHTIDGLLVTFPTQNDSEKRTILASRIHTRHGLFTPPLSLRSNPINAPPVG